MDTEFISVLFYFFVFIGVVVAFQDRKRLNNLVKKVSQLQNTIDQQARHIARLETRDFTTSDQLNSADEAVSPSRPSSEQPQIIEQPTVSTSEHLSADLKVTIARVKPAKPAFGVDFNLDALLKGNGLFWLGAIVLALGGVFLANYSIEAGLLPPSVRVILGALFGVCLVVTAEVLSRYKEKLKINTPNISAALASGGVVTCFAMTLVAFDFYDFIPANIAFVLLAIISCVATILALRFGPVLAGIGSVGAYLVPALVSTGSNNIGALLLYVGFVSLSAIWVADYVKQKWLWWQSFIGHFLWFCAAVATANRLDFWVIMLFALFSLYLYVLVAVLGWRLTVTMTRALPVKVLLMPRKEHLGILLPLSLVALTLVVNTHFTQLLWANTLFALVVLGVAYRHSALDSWPFYLLLFALFSFNLMPTVSSYDDVLLPFTGKYLFIQVAVFIAILFSVLMLRRTPSRLAYLLLLVLAPLALYGISYVTSPELAEAILYPVWAVEMLAIAAWAVYYANKATLEVNRVTCFILANTMLSLCFTMLLSASTLTLAIALQIASMSYLSWKYNVRIPDWLYKIALMVVMARLTFAPWLAHYRDETILTIHWTLIVYPIVLGIIWIAIKYNPSKALTTWFIGGAVHIVALLVTTETSYILFGAYPDFTNLTYQQSVMLALNWLALAAVYLWRGMLSNHKSKLYPKAAAILLLASSVLHSDISLINSPFLVSQYVGERVVNWLFLQWFVPAVILAGMIKFGLLTARYHRLVYSVIAVLVILFVNGAIRSLYHGGFVTLSISIQQPELYTYSIVWLLLSTVSIFVAKHFNLQALLHAGFAGLAIVILKAFIVDMANLEGLLRALSFIGLGLGLVGIGWLFQKMQTPPHHNEA
ncbi:DUF2339 domain-containing protein [Pseudoalteromonas piscicida]|uniref:DUF2339 domain-containing protein n=1 Tax=Pseudoalteromonas piscicida TaxID=43662 RepID=UPI0030A6E42D